MVLQVEEGLQGRAGRTGSYRRTGAAPEPTADRNRRCRIGAPSPPAAPPPARESHTGSLRGRSKPVQQNPAPPSHQQTLAALPRVNSPRRASLTPTRVPPSSSIDDGSMDRWIDVGQSWQITALCLCRFVPSRSLHTARPGTSRVSTLTTVPVNGGHCHDRHRTHSKAASFTRPAPPSS